ncbi:MAG: hypothetical protein PQJ44_06270, partial [Sphaerochaetaceae bacterium]|nr:hypothetical protein [Sphaerochaetaceae bacterium]
MKKISVLLIIVILSLSLTGCQLAVTDNIDSITNSDNISEADLGYIPIRFNSEIYDSETRELVD